MWIEIPNGFARQLEKQTVKMPSENPNQPIGWKLNYYVYDKHAYLIAQMISNHRHLSLHFM